MGHTLPIKNSDSSFPDRREISMIWNYQLISDTPNVAARVSHSSPHSIRTFARTVRATLQSIVYIYTHTRVFYPGLFFCAPFYTELSNVTRTFSVCQPTSDTTTPSRMPPFCDKPIIPKQCVSLSSGAVTGSSYSNHSQ